MCCAVAGARHAETTEVRDATVTHLPRTTVNLRAAGATAGSAAQGTAQRPSAQVASTTQPSQNPFGMGYGIPNLEMAEQMAARGAGSTARPRAYL